MSPFLVLHIAGGSGGLFAGAAAMVFRKGSRGHVVAGQVFVIAMLCMAGSGIYMAVMKSQIGNIMGGVITFYMVVTAWSTARPKTRPGYRSVFDWAALFVVFGFTTAALTLAVSALRSPTGLAGGYPAFVYLVWGFIALLSTAGDIRMLVRHRNFPESKRIVRHVWRMCFALFIASGSFFLGQQKVFPVSLRGSRVWFVPAFLPLVLLIYWVIRVRFKKQYRSILQESQSRNLGTRLSEQPLPG